MPDRDDPREQAAGHEPYPSTPYTFKRVKMSPAPQAVKAARPKGARSRWRRFPRRNRAEWITLRVKFRGGAESWYVVDSRGETNPIPGWMQLDDLMGMICQDR